MEKKRFKTVMNYIGPLISKQSYNSKRVTLNEKQ